jgi:hypothetical protein
MFIGEISCRKRCPACAVHMPAVCISVGVGEKLSPV